ncbi:MAG: preprotein translocase subunit SecE [Acetivibrionales bacterium]|jgi:preprotein translocase subunit SecE
MTEQKAKFGQRAGRFFKEIRLELKKVIWPTRQQLLNNTLTVFAACLLIGSVVWLADAGLGIIFRAVFGQ